MASSSTQATRSAIRYLIVAVILLVLLLGFALLYWQLLRPPQLSGESGQKDRNYMFSIYGFEGDLLRRPSSVGIASTGDIHVADTGKRRVVVFDPQGSFVTAYGDPGKEELQIWNPIDVAVAADGRSYVLDKGEKKIVVYDSQNRASRAIRFGDAIPLSVTIKGNKLYVTTESGIVVFDLDGNVLTGYVSWGKNAGQFDKPGGVTVDDDGNLFVADSLNYRVQAISSKGKPMWQYGEPIPPEQALMFNEESRKFGLPSSITMDESGKLYVVDGLNGEIVVLSKDGEFQERIGDIGHEDGTFYYPDGIDYFDGRLVVADKFNDRVEVFSIPRTGLAAWTGFAPWLGLLLLLPLLLLLLRRRPVYIATGEFVDTIAADRENAEMVSQALRRLVTIPEVAEVGKTLDDLAKLDWKPREVSEEDIQSALEKYLLSEDSASALAIAMATRGKRTLLSDDKALIAAAQDLEIPVLTYPEILEAIESKGAKPDELDAASADEEDLDGSAPEQAGDTEPEQTADAERGES